MRRQPKGDGASPLSVFSKEHATSPKSPRFGRFLAPLKTKLAIFIFVLLIVFRASMKEELVVNYLDADSFPADTESKASSNGSLESCDLHSQPPRKPKPCGRGNHTNETDKCGDWDIGTRTFVHSKSSGCKLRVFSPEQARKCVGNRTLAFIGDSQIRDLGVAVGMFLHGLPAVVGSEEKFDRKVLDGIMGYGEEMGKFSTWGETNVDIGNIGNGLVFPTMANSSNLDFQVQVWHLFRNDILDLVGSSGKSHVMDVLGGEMAGENTIRPVDIAFWSHGMHDWGWWVDEPYLDNYVTKIVSRWSSIRENPGFSPFVWVSMNTECREIMTEWSITSDLDRQARMVNTVNRLLPERMSELGLPYLDMDRFLRTPQLCNVSGDGVHARMWVDRVRVSMLFNYLCDSNNEWVGDTASFL